ncbi:MAG: GH36 C-terminal domain-containing protein [Imperialibacter sp.]
MSPIILNGLDPNKKYQLKEINLYSGARSWLNPEKVYLGDFLMKVGSIRW